MSAKTSIVWPDFSMRDDRINLEQFDLERQIIQQQMVRQIRAEEDARIMELLNKLCPHGFDSKHCHDPECQVRTVHES